MNTLARLGCALALMAAGSAAVADVTFFEDPGYRGRSFTTNRMLVSFDRTGFNDKVSSLVVRGEAWEFCEDPRFNGRCIVLRPGRYPSMDRFGMNDKFSSARPARRGPPPRR